MSAPEAMRQEAEDAAWTVLRALAQEHGMTDPSMLSPREQQLVWMGIKAGTVATVETIKSRRV